MHISMFVYGTWGDIRPHVVLGVALQQLGHDVQVIASSVYEQWVRERNLGFYPLTTDVNRIIKQNASALDMGIIGQLKITKTMLKPAFIQMGLEVLEATRQSDIIITVQFGLGLLFDILKVNNLRVILVNPAPLNPSSEFAFLGMPTARKGVPFGKAYNRFTYRLIDRIQWSAIAGARNEIATQHLGLPKSKIDDFRTLLANTPALTIVSKHVFERPSDWSDLFQVTGYLFDDDPAWTPPQDLTDFLADGEAPVYIGFGSMPDSNPQKTTQTIIEAVQRAGKRAIILTGWAGLGQDNVPGNIHILQYAPHSWLFPKMAAVIHHGGAGTTASAFRAGVPMTIVPHNADQPYWGKRVQELAVGTAPIPRKKLTTENLSDALQALTQNDEFRQNAQALAQKIGVEEGLSEAVKWVQYYLGE